MMTREELAVMYHEAGHAIVAHLTEFYVDDISVKPGFMSEGGAGICETDRRKYESREYIVVLFAGEQAHLRYAPDMLSDAALGAEFDHVKIRDIAARIRLSSDEVDDLRRQAAAIVEEHWIGIDRLVQELKQRPTIDNFLHDAPIKLKHLLESITGKCVEEPPVVDLDVM